MTTEQKALALVNEISREEGGGHFSGLPVNTYVKALCRAIEQHEAFKQEVSDAVADYFQNECEASFKRLRDFIIPAPEPDPLVEVLNETYGASLVDADELRAALEARGLEIREKGKCT